MANPLEVRPKSTMTLPVAVLSICLALMVGAAFGYFAFAEEAATTTTTTTSLPPTDQQPSVDNYDRGNAGRLDVSQLLWQPGAVMAATQELQVTTAADVQQASAIISQGNAVSQIKSLKCDKSNQQNSSACKGTTLNIPLQLVASTATSRTWKALVNVETMGPLVCPEAGLPWGQPAWAAVGNMPGPGCHVQVAVHEYSLTPAGYKWVVSPRVTPVKFVPVSQCNPEMPNSTCGGAQPCVPSQVPGQGDSCGCVPSQVPGGACWAGTPIELTDVAQ